MMKFYEPEPVTSEDFSALIVSPASRKACALAHVSHVSSFGEDEVVVGAFSQLLAPTERKDALVHDSTLIAKKCPVFLYDIVVMIHVGFLGSGKLRPKLASTSTDPADVLLKLAQYDSVSLSVPKNPDSSRGQVSEFAKMKRHLFEIYSLFFP